MEAVEEDWEEERLTLSMVPRHIILGRSDGTIVEVAAIVVPIFRAAALFNALHDGSRRRCRHE